MTVTVSATVTVTATDYLPASEIYDWAELRIPGLDQNPVMRVTYKDASTSVSVFGLTAVLAAPPAAPFLRGLPSTLSLVIDMDMKPPTANSNSSVTTAHVTAKFNGVTVMATRLRSWPLYIGGAPVRVAVSGGTGTVISDLSVSLSDPWPYTWAITSSTSQQLSPPPTELIAALSEASLWLLPHTAANPLAHREGWMSISRWALPATGPPVRRMYCRPHDRAPWGLRQSWVAHATGSKFGWCAYTVDTPLLADASQADELQGWMGDVAEGVIDDMASSDSWVTATATPRGEPFAFSVPMVSAVAPARDGRILAMLHVYAGPAIGNYIGAVCQRRGTLYSTLQTADCILVRPAASTAGPAPFPVAWEEGDGQTAVIACVTDGLYREWSMPWHEAYQQTPALAPALTWSEAAPAAMECWNFAVCTGHDGAQCLVGHHPDDSAVRLWYRPQTGMSWGTHRAEWISAMGVIPYVYQRADGLWEVGWLDGDAWVQWLSGDPTAAAVDWVVWS